ERDVPGLAPEAVVLRARERPALDRVLRDLPLDARPRERERRPRRELRAQRLEVRAPRRGADRALLERLRAEREELVDAERGLGRGQLREAGGEALHRLGPEPGDAQEPRAADQPERALLDRVARALELAE